MPSNRPTQPTNIANSPGSGDAAGDDATKARRATRAKYNAPGDENLTINGAPVRLDSTVKAVNNASMPKPLPPIQPPKSTPTRQRSEPIIRPMEANTPNARQPGPTPRTSRNGSKSTADPYSDPYAERTLTPRSNSRSPQRRKPAPAAPTARTRMSSAVQPGINHEIAGLAMAGIAILLLWSFFAQDGWIANPVGVTLKHYFGAGAIFVPFFIGFVGYTFFWEGITRTERIQQSRLMGAALAIVAFLGFIHLFTDDPQKLADDSAGGGLIGYTVSHLLSQPLTGFGAGVALVILLMIGLMLATNTTSNEAWDMVQMGYMRIRNRAIEARPGVDMGDEGFDDDEETPFSYDGRNTLPVQTTPRAVAPAPVQPAPRPLASRPSVAPGFDDDFDTQEIAPLQPKILGQTPPPGPKPPVINGATTMMPKRSVPPIIETVPPPPPAQAAPPPDWRLPKITLLTSLEDKGISTADLAVRDAELAKRGRLIEETLFSFGVEAYVREINTGPTVTQFALEPGVGVKVARITALSNDLALSLAAPTIRIEAPVPGQSRVGIEVPNKKSTTVNLRELMEGEEFLLNKSRLKIALGQDVAGQSVVADLARMPHLLIAGSTGSGKSVCINALVACLLCQYRPTDLQFIMIDPKMVELSTFNGIPHLKFPVVTQIDQDREEEERDRKFGPKPSGAGMSHLGASEPNELTPTVMSVLKWCTREMEKRYKLLSRTGHRNIEAYNKVALPGTGLEKMPFLVVMIDELADLMMAAPDEVETQICRLAQKGRACGIHLILATQRPSVDVVTGLIKANFPTRIAFAVTSQIDSRVILDTPGAEKLLGRGDMLFVPPDASKPARLQGTFVSDEEIDRIVAFWKEQNSFVTSQKGDFVQPQMFELREIERERQVSEDDTDELFETALEVVRDARTASTSLLQRRLRIGYNRAARLIDQLEATGVIGPAEGGRPRPVRFEAEDMPAQQDENHSSDFGDDNPPPAPMRQAPAVSPQAYRERKREPEYEEPSGRTFTSSGFSGARIQSGGLDDSRGPFAAPPGPPTRYAGRDDGGYGRADTPTRSVANRPSHDDEGFPPL